MLFALITAQRAQTLQFLFLDNIYFQNDCVTIYITNLLKQTTAKNRKFSLKLKKYDENPSICIVKVLKEYIKRTQSLRGSERQLLISFHKPYGAVSRNTISRWIKTVMFESGIDIDVFKAHSTRAASCSKAKFEGTPIVEILKTAGWKSDKTFEKFYDKCIHFD